MLAGRDILYDGLRKQVGDGCSIMIWEEPWVSSLSHFKIQSPKPKNKIFCWVPELKEGHTWNEALLNALFSSMKIVAIKQVPIRDSSYLNRWVWHHNNKGYLQLNQLIMCIRAILKQ